MYKKELWASSRLGREAIEKQEVTSAMMGLKDKVDELKRYGDQLAGDRKKLEASQIYIYTNVMSKCSVRTVLERNS